MKYVIMFTSTPSLAEDVTATTQTDLYERIYRWFGENADSIADSGAELQPVSTATTVRHGADGPVVTDGPFSEAKEIIGGFSVLDVPDLDAAIAIVKTWPSLELPGVAVEIRPMVTNYDQFEQ
ncbi:YciI family protein [Homoserinibacter sp. GY 40078]|uniref:YciI family protein n=1 Tax=Homoserinibacter sp. GY 40078 TaxID=2603275 RepID=UPI0011C712C5|nr:YciI family protein [Homoserinibacter sp. GY 40078]TXK20025.1 hypothetical protein FVQ89_06255 [Homoserinibacter sp. GY 40078]